MDLKKKVKGFFMLARKGDSGFTLVELIVVIAILAILGGVAVPAYSGYVKKAERAGDEQLLATINKAYAAACLENGTDMTLLEGASMPLTEANTVDIENVNPYKEAFARYYAGNENTAFKVYTPVFDTNKHMFVDLTNASEFAITINGVTYKADAESVVAFQNSTLGQLGTEKLMNMFNLAVDALGVDFGGAALPTALQSTSYKAQAAKMLGLVGDDATPDAAAVAYDAYIAEKKSAAMDQYFKEHPELDPTDRGDQKTASDAVTPQISALEKNLIPMVSASKAEEASQDILDILKSENAYKTIHGNVTDGNNSALGISQSALAYAIYSSYAGENASPDGFLIALNGMDSGFNAYLTDSKNEDKINADLTGALGAMDVISNQSSDTLDHTAVNGFKDTDLESALEQILGK